MVLKSIMAYELEQIKLTQPIKLKIGTEKNSNYGWQSFIQ